MRDGWMDGGGGVDKKVIISLMDFCDSGMEWMHACEQSVDWWCSEQRYG